MKPMKRYCLALDLKDDPELIAQYEAHHREVWPAIIQSIRDAGIEGREVDVVLSYETALIVHGIQDVIPLASAEETAALMGAQLVRLDGCGHVPYIEAAQPLFAAVAASCDGLAEAAPEAPRFLLLDDAFAKVSEDNHPKLFGLLVDLDLDFIATSERLWGTYATVPELAITEVVRDARSGVILLEHARWDGTSRVER